LSQSADLVLFGSSARARSQHLLTAPSDAAEEQSGHRPELRNCRYERFGEGELDMDVYESEPPSAFATKGNNLTLEPTDAIAAANEVAEFFAAISFETLASSEGGYRDRLYEFLSRTYRVGMFLSQCPSEYRRFKAEGFWRRSRQKPKDKNVMKWVVYFTTRATSAQMRNRAGKYAKVLEHFLRQDALPEEIVSRIKAGGGVDAIHLALCAGDIPCALEGDDSDELEEAVSEQVGAMSSSVDRRPPAASREATQGPAGRIDWSRTLLVDMDGSELSLVLDAKTATLRLEIGPRDEHGWSPIRGRLIQALGNVPN